MRVYMFAAPSAVAPDLRSRGSGCFLLPVTAVAFSLVVPLVVFVTCVALVFLVGILSTFIF